MSFDVDQVTSLRLEPSRPERKEQLDLALKENNTPFNQPPASLPDISGMRASLTSAEEGYIAWQFVSVRLSNGKTGYLPIPLKITGENAKLARDHEDALRKKIAEKFPAHGPLHAIDFVNRRAVFENRRTESLKEDEYLPLIQNYLNVYEQAAAATQCGYGRLASPAGYRGHKSGPECLSLSTARLKTRSKTEWEALESSPLILGRLQANPDRGEVIELKTRCKRIRQFLTDMPGLIEPRIKALNKPKDPSEEEELSKLLELRRLLNPEEGGYKRFALYAAALLGDDASREQMKQDVELLSELFETEFRIGWRRSDNKPNRKEIEFIEDVALLRAKNEAHFVTLSEQLGRAVAKDAPEWHLLRAARLATIGKEATAAEHLCKHLGVSEETIRDGIRKTFEDANAL